MADGESARLGVRFRMWPLPTAVAFLTHLALPLLLSLKSANTRTYCCCGFLRPALVSLSVWRSFVDLTTFSHIRLLKWGGGGSSSRNMHSLSYFTTP